MISWFDVSDGQCVYENPEGLPGMYAECDRWNAVIFLDRKNKRVIYKRAIVDERLPDMLHYSGEYTVREWTLAEVATVLTVWVTGWADDMEAYIALKEVMRGV